MKTEWLTIINNQRNSHFPEWTTIPEVLTEETDQKVFDIVDTKDFGEPIIRTQGSGQSTYFNGDDNHTYCLRFIKVEEFMNQFKITTPTGQTLDWTKGMTRPDYIAYDSSGQNAYFIIHELSSGTIRNKKSDGMKQLLNMVLFLHKSSLCKQYCDGFAKRLCFISARGCVTTSPNSMANGFMEIYKNLPEPLPLSNKSIESRGFEAYMTNVVKL